MEIENISVGRKVYWYYSPPGGRSTETSVEAEVIKVNRVKVRIRFLHHKKTIERDVYPESLIAA